jgi:hypothetical protein
VFRFELGGTNNGRGLAADFGTQNGLLGPPSPDDYFHMYFRPSEGPHYDARVRSLTIVSRFWTLKMFCYNSIQIE